MLFFFYTFIAFLAVHIGNENRFVELIRIPSYYTDLLLALCCSFTLGYYIHELVQWMELKFPWLEVPKTRLIAQLLLGVILPSAVILGLEVIYLSILNIKLENSSIFYLELPVIFILCLVINFLHISLYQNYLTRRLRKKGNSEKERTDYKQNFVVQAGKGFLNIPSDEVAYFKILNKLTFLVTQNGQSYLYDFLFKEIIDGLPPEEFFQLNRQIIAKRSSIVKSVQTDTRRLKIELTPSMEEPIFVSKNKASNFMTWLHST